MLLFKFKIAFLLCFTLTIYKSIVKKLFLVYSHAGSRLSLSEWGIGLLIPEGALDRGYTEEVFLAVMREGRDRPTLADRQTTLSPIVLAGPPRLSFKKPIVLR